MDINFPTARAVVDFVKSIGQVSVEIPKSEMSYVAAAFEAGYANLKLVIELDDSVTHISNIDTVDTDGLNTDLLG